MNTTTEGFVNFANGDTEQTQKQAEEFRDFDLWEDFLKSLSMLGMTEHDWCEHALRAINPNTCTNIEDALADSAKAFVLRVDSEKLKSFPIALIPDSIRSLAIKIADYAKVPASIPALAICSMYSASLGKNLRVRSASGRTTPGNIYVIIFCDSGTGKSDVYRIVFKPMKDRQEKDAEAWAIDKSPEFQMLLEIKEAEIKSLKNSIKKSGASQSVKDDLVRLAKERAEIERQIKAPLYFGEDYTVEALGQILQKGDEQLASISPEALKVIQNLSGLYKDGNVEDSIYNKAYTLESGRVDRISREPVILKEPCMSILWFTQPDKIPDMFNSNSLVKGGFAPRFISLFEECKAQEMSWEGKSIDQDEVDDYCAQWNMLFDAYRLGGMCQEIDQQTGEEVTVPRIVEVADAVKDFMVDHFNRLVGRRNGDLYDVKEFVARWTENAWRIALVFHASMHGKLSHEHKLSLDTAKAACAVMDWCAEGQLKIIKKASTSGERGDLERLVEAVTKNGGAKLFGKLKDDNGFSPEDLERLVKASSGVLEIKENGNKVGRQGRVVRLVSK